MYVQGIFKNAYIVRHVNRAQRYLETRISTLCLLARDHALLMTMRYHRTTGVNVP